MLISVTDLNGLSEPLNNYQRPEIIEEVNGAFTLSVTSFFNENNPGHALIKEESLLSIGGYDFRVKQLRESNSRKEVVAISSFYDLTGKRKDDIYGGTRTFNEFASFIYGNTGWTFASVDVTGSAFIPNFGEDNVIKLTQALCAVYECEYKILPNKQIQFAKQIGGDYDAQYRYGHNVKTLSKSVDTTNLRTSIKGYGGGGLVITYTSPNASKFPAAGEAEPVSDDRFTIADSLIEHAKRNLVDYPETTIELDSVELTDKELGERVWLIYEPLDIEFQTRIMSKKSVLRDGKLVTASVVIGNTVPRDMSDILTSQKIEIDENKKQTQSRFEQTNERITLEVERIDDSIATISVEADEIKLNVTSLGGRIGDAEATITIHADEISSKVSSTDYNGNTIASMINQTSTTIDIQASKINLVGAVTVLSDITGKLGNITAGNIDIMDRVYVGDGIYLRGNTDKSLFFENDTYIRENQGSLLLNVFNDLTISASHTHHYGVVNLSTASSINWGSHRPTAVWG